MTSPLAMMLTVGGLFSLTTGALILFLLFPGLPARAALALERRLAGLRTRRIAVGGLRWVYSTGGRGTPLVLLHGIGAERNHWNRVARGLHRQFHIIAPDLPGFGDSAKPADGDYSIDGQVRALDEFLDALGLRQICLGGNSMGGWIAAHYAARHPERVRALWLLAPAGVEGAQPSEMLRAVEAGETPPLFARSRSEFQRVLNFVTARRPWAPGFVLSHLATRAAANYALHSAIFARLYSERPAIEPLAARLSMPTLLVWGARDCVLHPSGTEILGRLLPRVEVERMDAIGHLPMLEAPAACARRWLDFADRHGTESTP